MKSIGFVYFTLCSLPESNRSGIKVLCEIYAFTLSCWVLKKGLLNSLSSFLGRNVKRFFKISQLNLLIYEETLPGRFLLKEKWSEPCKWENHYMKSRLVKISMMFTNYFSFGKILTLPSSNSFPYAAISWISLQLFISFFSGVCYTKLFYGGIMLSPYLNNVADWLIRQSLLTVRECWPQPPPQNSQLKLNRGLHETVIHHFLSDLAKTPSLTKKWFINVPHKK